MLDTHRALSMTDEDERIQILQEMEKSCLGILMVIGYEHIIIPWYGASDELDMRYTLPPYVLDMPPPYILQMSSLHVSHMPPPYDPQMPRSSSSYVPQMTALDSGWHHECLSEWFEQLGIIPVPCQYDSFITDPSFDPDEGVEGVT